VSLVQGRLSVLGWSVVGPGVLGGVVGYADDFFEVFFGVFWARFCSGWVMRRLSVFFLACGWGGAGIGRRPDVFGELGVVLASSGVGLGGSSIFQRILLGRVECPQRACVFWLF